ncbi:Acyltransferase [Botrimarina colliarenosi]|uniref:Acyltransferase n=1 Tax=Botrimarina colliarenosi TaxID=2528001 RepID=A0A5C6AQ90_9BACT|nr:lysophospholipid acyltransferase family protein [Botrimarina colliarenosi]TWU00364.1 Acyltransferase [Botrimarina colliarenosi]
MSKRVSDAPPRVSAFWLRWFRWYLRRYLRKSFHAVAVGGPEPAIPRDAPLVVYLNHASWWDPLVAMHLAERITPARTLYAPFDAAALARYPIFEKLGFFGVEQQTRRGAAQFLRTARSVFATPDTSIWMTPEGRFVDPREEAPAFQPGLAHLVADLAERAPDAVVLPLAIEYVFWEERLPEALVWFGEPVRLRESRGGLDKAGWDDLLRARLRAAQGELAARSIARDASAFRVVLGGTAGVGGAYEPARWLHAKLTGQAYRAAHSEKF